MKIKAHFVISIFWILKKKSDVSDYCKLTKTAFIIWRVILLQYCHCCPPTGVLHREHRPQLGQQKIRLALWQDKEV